MKLQPLVSIALTTFNGITFIEQLVKSLQSQTFQDFEVIVYDDCSTDGTFEYMLGVSKKDPRFLVYRNNENIGYIKNFEICLSKISGSYVFLCDQDDIWKPQKLATGLNFLKDNLFVYSDAELIDEKNRIIFDSFNTQKGPRSRIGTFESLLEGNYITGCTIAFRTELLDSAFPFPSTIPHDYWLSLVASTRQKLFCIDEKLICYRQHQNNVFGAFVKEKNNSVTKKQVVLNRIQKLDFLLTILQSHLSEYQFLFLNNYKSFLQDYFDKRLRIRSGFFMLRNYYQIKGFRLTLRAFISSFLTARTFRLR